MMALADVRRQLARRLVGGGGGFLDEDGGGDELVGCTQPADRKILDGALSLDAVVRIGRDGVFAERIALNAVHTIHYTTRMLPGFFDSVLELIVKTSTDLPPDVRAAMKGAMGAEQPGTRSAQALTIIAQNIDQAAIGRRRDLPGHGHADVRGACAARHRSDLDAQADSRGGGESDQPRQAAAEFRRLDHRRKLRRQPRARHADHPFRSVGRGRRRSEAAAEGRRLREHEHSVFAAGGAGRTSAAPIARSKGCASASCTRCGMRRARAARRARSACASAAIARPDISTRKSSCSGRSTT